MTEEKTIIKPWYKTWWAITLFVILGMGIIGSFSEENKEPSKKSETTEKTEVKQEIKAEKEPQKELTNYADDVGKTYCNATNNICKGKIIEVKKCATDEKQQCYVVDMGEGYSRPAELPVSNSYAKQASTEDESISYEFVDTKNEVAGSNNNKMDLYAYSGDIDLATLKALCEKKKQEFTSGTFYFLVVFDKKENAKFPTDPFTASYGAEEDKMKHIKAVYTYNRLNGFSELDYYDKNKWESVAKTEKL